MHKWPSVILIHKYRRAILFWLSEKIEHKTFKYTINNGISSVKRMARNSWLYKIGIYFSDFQ